MQNLSLLRSVVASWCKSNISMTTKKSFNSASIIRNRSAPVAKEPFFLLTNSKYSNRLVVPLLVRRLRKAIQWINRNTLLLMRVRLQREETILRSTMNSWTSKNNSILSNSSKRSSWWNSKTSTTIEKFLRIIKCTCRWWAERTNQSWGSISHMLTHPSWSTPNLTRDEIITRSWAITFLQRPGRWIQRMTLRSLSQSLQNQMNSRSSAVM